MKIAPFACSDEDRRDINWFIMSSTSWSFKLIHQEDIERHEKLCNKDFIHRAIWHLRETAKARTLNIWELNFFDRLNGSVPQYIPQ
jgi:hypothetical protein